jgi:hypothetical protein
LCLVSFWLIAGVFVGLFAIGFVVLLLCSLRLVAGSRPGGRGTFLLRRQKKSTPKKRRPCLCAACGGSQSAGLKNGQKRTRPFWRCAPNGAQTTFLLYPFFSPALWRKRRVGDGIPGQRAALRPVLGRFFSWFATLVAGSKLIRALQPNIRRTGRAAARGTGFRSPRRSGRAEQRRGEGIRKARCLSEASLRLSPSTRAAQGTGKAGPDCGSPFFWVLFFGEAKKSASPAGARPGFSPETNHTKITAKLIANKPTNLPARSKKHSTHQFQKHSIQSIWHINPIQRCLTLQCQPAGSRQAYPFVFQHLRHQYL